MSNRTAAQRNWQRIATDRGNLTRRAHTPHADSLNTETLELTARYDDPAIVWTGPALIHPATDQGGAGGSEQGGQVNYWDTYDLRLPIEARPRVGDQWTTTDSADPELLDREFTIIEVLGSTMAVTRQCKMRAKQRGPRL